MVTAVLAGCAGQATSRTPPPSVTGAEIVDRVRSSFFDPAAGAAWADRHAGLGAGCAPEEWPAAARAALAELHASHTDYVAVDDPRHAALLAIFSDDGPRGGRGAAVDGIGVDVVVIEGRSYVARIAAGSPAAAIGVVRGDEIVACDGGPFHPVRSLQGKSTVRLALRHREAETPVEYTIRVQREPLRTTWLVAERDGTRVERLDDVLVGVVPVVSGAGEEYRAALDEAIRSSLRRADGLVIDLRDGYGGCTPEWSRLFALDVPTVVSLDRNRRSVRYDPQWRGPLVVLVNRGTRSGKEMLARSLQRGGRATLVGERTAGAVLGGQIFDLADGGLLYLATQDVRIDGERLEGVGVVPDVEVVDRIAFAAGSDPILERGLAVAAQAVRDARRAGTLPDGSSTHSLSP